MGRSPGLENYRITKSSKSKSQHSGATARDSHPFPYSPHLLGHPDTFKYKEQFVIDADTITRPPTLSNQGIIIAVVVCSEDIRCVASRICLR